MNLPSVLVVEDDSFTRSTLCAALEIQGHQTPGPAANASQAIASFKRNHQAAALLDVDLGDGPTGVETAWLLRKMDPALGIVFLTSFEDPRLLKSHLAKLPPGSKYLVKQAVVDRSEISLALAAAAKWAKSQFQDAVTGVAITAPELAELTSVQIETLRLLSQGLSNKEIAKQRMVVEKTVEQTINRIAEHLMLTADTKQNQRVALAKAFSRFTGGKL